MKSECLMKVKEVADLTSMSVSWVYQQVELNTIPHVRLGKSIRFRTDDIQAWIDDQAKSN